PRRKADAASPEAIVLQAAGRAPVQFQGEAAALRPQADRDRVGEADRRGEGGDRFRPAALASGGVPEEELAAAGLHAPEVGIGRALAKGDLESAAAAHLRPELEREVADLV